MSAPHTVTFRAKVFHVLLFCAAALLSVLPQSARAQKTKVKAEQPPAPPSLTRTATRHETRRFAPGGTFTLYGAPEGSITIEAWPRSEIDITADIELRANTEEDLTRLATVNGFVLDDDTNHLSIITTGTHDRKYMKRVAKDFPRHLLALPWKIDYRIRVPAFTDLDLYAGHGPLTLAGVEGGIQLNAGNSVTSLRLTGGDVAATITSGSVNVRLAARSWRGRGADIRLAQGDLTVELPAGFNADINADVLHTGRIENTYASLTPRDRTPPTERSQRLRAGAGGATLSFTVGAGTLRIKQADAK